MARAMVQAEAHFVYRLQSVGGFSGRSDQLNAYNVFLGEPGFFERDLARYRTATGESVRAAVSRWLVEAPSVALSVVPLGRADLALAGSAPAVQP